MNPSPVKKNMTLCQIFRNISLKRDMKRSAIAGIGVSVVVIVLVVVLAVVLTRKSNGVLPDGTWTASRNNAVVGTGCMSNNTITVIDSFSGLTLTLNAAGPDDFYVTGEGLEGIGVAKRYPNGSFTAIVDDKGPLTFVHTSDAC
jgi:hypothetical protein